MKLLHHAIFTMLNFCFQYSSFKTLLFLFIYHFIPCFHCQWLLDHKNSDCTYNQLIPNVVLLYSNFGLLVEENKVFKFGTVFDKPESTIYSLQNFYPEIPENQTLILSYLISYPQFYLRFLYSSSYYYVYFRLNSRVLETLDMTLETNSSQNGPTFSLEYSLIDDEIGYSNLNSSFRIIGTEEQLQHLRNNSSNRRRESERYFQFLTSKMTQSNYNIATDEYLLKIDIITNEDRQRLPATGANCATFYPVSSLNNFFIVAFQKFGNFFELMLGEMYFPEDKENNLIYVQVRSQSSQTDSVAGLFGRCLAYGFFPAYINNEIHFKAILVLEKSVFYCSDCLLPEFEFSNVNKSRQSMFLSKNNDDANINRLSRQANETFSNEIMNLSSSQFDNEFFRIKSNASLKKPSVSSNLCTLTENLSKSLSFLKREEYKCEAYFSKKQPQQCKLMCLEWKNLFIALYNVSITKTKVEDFGEDYLPYECIESCLTMDLNDWMFAFQNETYTFGMRKLWQCETYFPGSIPAYQLYFFVPIVFYMVWFIYFVGFKRFLKGDQDVAEFRQQLSQHRHFRESIRNLLYQKEQLYT